MKLRRRLEKLLKVGCSGIFIADPIYTMPARNVFRRLGRSSFRDHDDESHCWRTTWPSPHT